MENSRLNRRLLSPPLLAPHKNNLAPAFGKRLRVVLRMSSDDAFELKTQALNNDSRLKDAGIAALKFVGDKRYISNGEFSQDVPSPDAKPDTTINKKVRVTLRVPRKDAYELVVKHLNKDPDLIKAGISGVELAKGAGMVPVAKEAPAKPPKKKRNFTKVIFATALIGFIESRHES